MHTNAWINEYRNVNAGGWRQRPGRYGSATEAQQALCGLERLKFERTRNIETGEVIASVE